jgi:hypothetical protein
LKKKHEKYMMAVDLFLSSQEEMKPGSGGRTQKRKKYTKTKWSPFKWTSEAAHRYLPVNPLTV